MNWEWGEDLLAGPTAIRQLSPLSPGKRSEIFAIDVKSLHTMVQTRPLTQKNIPGTQIWGPLG